MKDDSIFNNLKEFVIKQSCVNDEEVTRETRIEDDLGVSGDDAVDFLIAFGKQFNVDVTNFKTAVYFSSEFDVTLGSCIIRFITGKPKRLRKVFNVGHLEMGIYAGKLDYEVIYS